ncbi:D-alanyl-D-alanine carboxypeptidase, partial [Sinorhizobium meliloti]
MRMKSDTVSQSVFFDLAKRPFGVFTEVMGRIFLAGLIAVLTFSAPAFANSKYAGIVVDAKTGKVLYGEDADQLRYPASLTKMMTLYLTFEALEAGRISKSTPVPFSKKASAEPPSKLGVRAGRSITVEQAILSLVTRSANDAATALGELLGGSEQRFARMMTNKARALGMTRTTYRNAHGLPNSEQRTTARDQARLGIALRQHFPQ